eukprot:EC794642.1.p3 GENE.EC794642.1~~EC794642.1.p3  ORF type:complete len:101 (+),score=2.69 EC794642.1:140-442(+)
MSNLRKSVEDKERKIVDTERELAQMVVDKERIIEGLEKSRCSSTRPTCHSSVGFLPHRSELIRVLSLSDHVHYSRCLSLCRPCSCLRILASRQASPAHTQ